MANENLIKAVISVMKEVKGIDKTMAVGSGRMQYKGVPDQQVKIIIGEAMARNGLALVPIDIDETTEVSRWEETTSYQGTPQTKQKQSVFTKVKVKYLLMHESGESQELSGYGHGVDSMDKGAGKSTTYALKYTLLYTFLVPTGKIDDSDATHSNETPTPQKKPTKKTLTDDQFDSVIKMVEKNEYTFEQLEANYILIPDQKQLITEFKTKS